MGHKVPFNPVGTCRDCRFSKPTSRGHYQEKYHDLVCKRFPPTGATNAPGDGPWSHETFVHNSSFCGEWKKE